LGISNMEASLSHTQDVVMRHDYRLRLLEDTLGAVKQMALAAAQGAGGGMSSSTLTPCLTGGGGLPAGSYSAPGSATVTILSKAGPGSGYTTTSQTQTAYNPSSTAVGASKFIWCKNDGGDLVLVSGDC
jgi:hypothetical protein